MAVYNSLTSRTDAQPLIPEEVVRDMMGRATDESAVMQMFRRVPVSRNQVRFPVLSALPLAYFVTGDTGLKQTTEVNWTNKYLNIEEIATIMPVPENVVDDIEGNLWDEVQPYLIEAFGRTLDAAVFFGTNAPASWPTNITSAATSASNTVDIGDHTAAQGGFLGDIDALYGKVEADGFDVNGFVANRSVKASLRSARDTLGQKIDAGRVSPGLDMLDGNRVAYPMRGLWPTAADSPLLFAGDWSQFVLGVRSDISMKVLTESVIQDNTGAIVYNLAQQDMVALRLTFRIGWQVANLLNYDQPTEASRYPVGILTSD